MEYLYQIHCITTIICFQQTHILFVLYLFSYFLLKIRSFFRKGIVLNTVIDTLILIDRNEKIRLADTPQEHPLEAIISIKGSFF